MGFLPLMHKKKKQLMEHGASFTSFLLIQQCHNAGTEAQHIQCSLNLERITIMSQFFLVNQT